jgi:MmyB-like transcription regulator ligand binding domain
VNGRSRTVSTRGLTAQASGLSMAWNKVANDTVAPLSAEAGTTPTIAPLGPHRALSSQATNSCPAGRSRRPDHSTGVQLIHHAVVSDLDLAFETVPLAGRSQMLFTYTAEPGFALAVRPSRLLARWAANTDGFEPAASTDPSQQAESYGRAD